MFEPNLSIEALSGPDRTFALVKNLGTETLRMDTATTLREPKHLKIAHTPQGAAGKEVDHHLVQFTHTKATANSGPMSAVVNLTIKLPRDVAFDNDDVKRLLTHLLDFVLDFEYDSPVETPEFANVAALLQGQS